MDSKSFVASKTVWINAALAGVAALWGTLSPALDPQLVIAIGAIANIVLRVVTKQPVTLVPK